MADENKKPEEEKAEPNSQDSTEPPNEPKGEPKLTEKAEEKPKDTPEEKPADEKQGEENGEGAESDNKPDTELPKEEISTEAEPPKLSAEDELRAENFALKTQIEAMKLGFSPDCIEDAVVLAENIVKRDGSDIATALQTVAKKYPDWKQQSKNKSGFKIGSDGGNNSKPTSEDKLNNAFGIKKKG